ncbi:cell division cycle protein 20 homolog B [Pleurodeles waltl]
MEWKLQRVTSRRIKTDDDMLWESIMKTLDRDLKKTRRLSSQKGSKTPEKGTCSYSRFKKNIVKRLTSTIPVASSPIATRWQQIDTRNFVHFEHTMMENLTFSSSSSFEEDLFKTPDHATTIAATSEMPFSACASGVSNPVRFTGRRTSHVNYTQARSQFRHHLLSKQKLFSEMKANEKPKSSHLGYSAMEICEKGTCTVKGCQEKNTTKSVVQKTLTSIREEFAPFHSAVRLHITGLRNDYYLNLLDWSYENLIAFGLNSSAHIWDGESCGALGRIDLSSSSKYISSVSWIKEGACLAVGTSDGEVQLWDIETKKRLRNMLGHVSVVGALNWNQHILTSGSRLGFIHHHDVRIPEHHIGTARHKQAICSLKWSPSGHLLASGSSDGALNIWPNDPGATMQSKPITSLLHATSVKAMNWCPWISDTLGVGGGMKDGCVRVWDVSSGTVIHSAETSSQICSLLWLPQTKELVTGHGLPKHQLTLWNYPSLTQVTEIYGHRGRVLHLAMSPDQRKIFSSAADGMANVWEYHK